MRLIIDILTRTFVANSNSTVQIPQRVSLGHLPSSGGGYHGRSPSAIGFWAERRIQATTKPELAGRGG